MSTVWNLHPEKALGPNGLTISFYHSFWYVINKDLLKIIRYVIKKKKVGGLKNSTFFPLIPKDPRPSSLKKFRPISLCNASYKIIYKILARRLKPLLHSLISENQGGFVPNRQIVDNIILVQEALQSIFSCNE